MQKRSLQYFSFLHTESFIFTCQVLNAYRSKITKKVTYGEVFHYFEVQYIANTWKACTQAWSGLIPCMSRPDSNLASPKSTWRKPKPLKTMHEAVFLMDLH
jgi:hypothetical protein